MPNNLITTMNLKYIFFDFLLILYYHGINCKTERITYFSTERPAVYWYDTNFFKNVSIKCRRVSRQDPRYYTELYVHTLHTITNDWKMDFYFYQFLTNRYRPSFVEMHFGFCDMFHSDTFFGQSMRIAAKGVDCPVPPGVYDLKNMTIGHVPVGFPFPKGRIYLNVSLSNGSETELIARTSVDIEIKVAKILI